MAKTRLTPNKGICIPCLEILADLIGKRCLKFVVAELNLNIA